MCNKIANNNTARPTFSAVNTGAGRAARKKYNKRITDNSNQSTILPMCVCACAYVVETTSTMTALAAHQTNCYRCLFFVNNNKYLQQENETISFIVRYLFLTITPTESAYMICAINNNNTMISTQIRCVLLPNDDCDEEARAQPTTHQLRHQWRCSWSRLTLQLMQWLKLPLK